MYLGVIAMIFSWIMTSKFSKVDDIFNRMEVIDRKIVTLIGSNEKIRKSERTQFRFEFNCVAAATVAYVTTSVYDIGMYPP